MKRKITYTVALAIVLVMIAVTALAVALLTPREVVEQVAVPMAQGNDKEWRIEEDFTPEELAAFIRACSENGIDLDENHAIMEAIRSGEGYNEEEAIMAVCRVAFGGNFGEWTLAQRRWFEEMMVSIGWATSATTQLPGPEDLPEEEARSRMLAAIRAQAGEETPLEDREQYEVMLQYQTEADSDGTVWTLYCRPRGDYGTHYQASLDRAGSVLSVDRWEMEPRPEGETPIFVLTEEEAIRRAAEAIRQQYQVDTPLEDPACYRWFVNPSRRGEAVWNINFISLTVNGGFCETQVKDATGEVTIGSADVGPVTADNILARYRNQYGWYDAWDTTVWAEVAAKAADLPATQMEGLVTKATPWIAWREGLLTRDEAEEKAFRQTGVKMGDVNCACLIDARPNPIWKLRLLPWDGSWEDSIVVEIDAVTGEMTDVDLYKSDHQALEPSFHMVTLRRIWSRLEYEQNGPLYIAALAVLHKYSDMTLDMPEVDDMPILNTNVWRTQIDGRTVRFISRWAGRNDYEVELDEDGMAVRVEEKPSGAAEELPEELSLETGDESLYGVNFHAQAEALAKYGVDPRLWPLEAQMAAYPEEGRTVPREGEMTLEEAVAFARTQLPEEARRTTENAAVGASLYRIDADTPGEFTRWTIFFLMDDKGTDAWRVTFVDKHPEGEEYGVDVKEPGDNGNG